MRAASCECESWAERESGGGCVGERGDWEAYCEGRGRDRFRRGSDDRVRGLSIFAVKPRLCTEGKRLKPDRCFCALELRACERGRSVRALAHVRECLCARAC